MIIFDSSVNSRYLSDNDYKVTVFDSDTDLYFSTQGDALPITTATAEYEPCMQTDRISTSPGFEYSFFENALECETDAFSG